MLQYFYWYSSNCIILSNFTCGMTAQACYQSAVTSCSNCSTIRDKCSPQEAHKNFNNHVTNRQWTQRTHRPRLLVAESQYWCSMSGLSDGNAASHFLDFILRPPVFLKPDTLVLTVLFWKLYWPGMWFTIHCSPFMIQINYFLQNEIF